MALGSRTGGYWLIAGAILDSFALFWYGRVMVVRCLQGVSPELDRVSWVGIGMRSIHRFLSLGDG